MTNNILQDACDFVKVDLSGDPEDNVKYMYAIAKAIEEMGHIVQLLFTDRRAMLQTVRAIVLKEELDRLKLEKLTMLQFERWEYVNKWKLECNIFLNNTWGMEDGPQFKFLMGILIAPTTSKKQLPFFAGSHPCHRGSHGL